MDFLEYNFEATIKMLVILSSQPRKQIDAMGLGDTEDEIAMDYRLYFTSNKDAHLCIKVTGCAGMVSEGSTCRE